MGAERGLGEVGGSGERKGVMGVGGEGSEKCT